MNFPVRTLAIVLTIACAATAANPPGRKRLTAQRVAELTSALPAKQAKQYTIEITGLAIPEPAQSQPVQKPTREFTGRVTFPVGDPGVTIEAVREFRYPVKFDPPKAATDGLSIVAPLKPKEFGMVNTGWTIRMNASPSGQLIAVSGKADYVEAELMNGGYGAVAGPIYDGKGDVLSPNVVHQPKVKTTSTSFHLFAVPGEPYEITLYRGDKAEKHTIKVSAD